MPFTLAHPVAAIGSGRLGLVPSAVVAGAMAPDAFYYLPDRLSALLPAVALTHSGRGWWTVDLVVGLVLVTAWRLALRRPVLDLLPRPLADIARHETAGPVVRRRPAWIVLRDLAVVVGSVLIGTASHLLLDLVTHESPAGGELGVLLDLRVGGLAVHDVLQVVLSVLGLAGMAWWGWAWQRSRRAGRPLTWSVVSALTLASVLVASVVGAAAAIAADLAGHPGVGLTHVVISALVGAVSAGTAVVLAYSVGWWLARAWIVSRDRRPRRRAVPARSPAAPPPSRTAG